MSHYRRAPILVDVITLPAPLTPGGHTTGPLTNTSNLNLGYALAVLAAVLWGLTYCLDEKVLSHLSVFKLYFLHCLCGVMVVGGMFIFVGSAIIVLAQ